MPPSSYKIVLIIKIKEGLEAGMEAKNFTNYLIYINVYMIVLILTYFFFFNTELKRSKVKRLSISLTHLNWFIYFKENENGKHIEKHLPSLTEDSEILKPLNQDIIA